MAIIKNNVVITIENILNDLNENERLIANYILRNPEKVIYLSTSDMAKNCTVSESTLIRFCKKIGLSGFKELKVTLSVNLPIKKSHIENINIYESISINDKADEIIKKVTYGNKKALDDTEKIIDPEQLNLAINAISKARNVYLLGIGGSHIPALDFQYKLLRINIQAQLFEDYHLQLVTSTFITKDDVVIGFSNSGTTKEILNIMEVAKNNNATTIAITQLSSSKIRKYSDIILFTSTTENNMRIGAMASRIAQLNIVDALFVGVLSKTYKKSEKYLKDTKIVVDKRK